MGLLTQIKIGLIILIFAILGILVYSNDRLRAENKRIALELNTANSLIKASSELAVKKREIESNAKKELQQIDSSPESDDGDIAPVLSNTINRLYK